MPTLCHDCLAQSDDRPARCPACRSPRLVTHAELFDLTIAHMDCDAFYASVEKRDRPDLRDRPVIVGGGTRGVVSTCCYLARIRGVRSAMPMFQALRLCPEAVVVKPRMEVYAQVSRAIRGMMEALTPAIEPLSLDEAFLDLTGTARLHGAPAAVVLAGLLNRIEADLGVTGSVGLSHNKFLAKIASDLDKPRGFSVIGRAETGAFLAARPVRVIWGVGTATQGALEAAGIRTVADILRWDRRDLIARFGSTGDRLWSLARGLDSRRVDGRRPVRSVSRETTFDADTGDPDLMQGHLWRLSEQLADRLKARGIAGRTVTLKVKRADFALITRRATLPHPVQGSDRIWRAAQGLYDALGNAGPWRLVGVGLSDLSPAAETGTGDLLDPEARRRDAAEAATDAIRARFGADAIIRGRALR